jgi:GDP-L-fucose synthase
MKIIITGGSGMVGKNLIYFLNNNTNHQLLYPSSSELNLLNFSSVKCYIKKEKPEIIIHCAGLVGGIQSNIELPYSFLSHNLIMGSNLIEGAVLNKVPKLINLGSSCMYPKNLNKELEEQDILT